MEREVESSSPSLLGELPREDPDLKAANACLLGTHIFMPYMGCNALEGYSFKKW